MLIDFLMSMFGAYGAGAAASVLGGRWANATRLIGHAGLFTGALAGVALSVQLLVGSAFQHTLFAELPHLFPFVKLVITIDGLGAFFILVV